jgi:hypothetical protein
MQEVFEHLDHVPVWRAALRGSVDWNQLLAGYVAAVDWPASAFWRELAAEYPNAVVVLSTRDPDEWWDSANATVLERARVEPEPDHADAEWHLLFRELLERFVPDWDKRSAAIAAYELHNEKVREAFRGSGRFVEWQASDGWEPLCKILGLPVPDEPFPNLNSRQDWLTRRRAMIRRRTKLENRIGGRPQ